MESESSRPEPADVVLAAVMRVDLGATLAAIHRNGYGHLTRVLDPERGEVSAQTRRAGVAVPFGFALDASSQVAVMIAAAARTPAAADLLRSLGAVRVWTTGRTTAPTPLLIGSLANLTTRVGRARTRSHSANEQTAD